MTNSEMLKMETGPDKAVSFTLNFARNQFGNQIARKVAALLKAGHSVEVVSVPLPQGDSKMGFRVDGEFRDWKTF